MRTRTATTFDPAKILKPEIIHANLLLSSLYLSAFEILKLAIIQEVKEFYVFAEEVSDEQFRMLRQSLQKENRALRARFRFCFRE